MKKVFTSVMLLLFSVALYAQYYSISNVVFDPPSPDTLLPGERVNITYNYTKTGGDIRIGITPFQSAGYGNSGTSGYALKTSDTGTGDAFFLYYNGAKIDSVTFRFVNPDWTLLYDTTVAVDYTYHKFYIGDLMLSPASPGILGFGDSIKFTFSYEKSYGDVKIQPMGVSNGTVIPKQTTSVSPVYSGETGQGSGFIRIDSLASVDQIMFQFLDAQNNDTLIELNNNVYYSFTDDINSEYSISNVVCDPPSPANVKLNEQVKINFDYTKPYGDVRIYVYPLVSEGSYNYGTAGSPLYTDNSGSGEHFFVFYDEAKVEKLEFRIQSPSGTLIYKYEEDVFFTVTKDSTLDYSIDNVIFTPLSPATLNTGDTIKVSFDYTKPFGEVYFWLKPLKEGLLNTGFEVPDLGAFSENTGTVETYILYDIATSFDQVQIQMKTSLDRILAEIIEDVDYTYEFAPFALSNVMLTPPPPDTLERGDTVKIQFDYFNPYNLVNIRITPMENGSPKSGGSVWDYESPVLGPFVPGSGIIKTYLVFNTIDKFDELRVQIKDSQQAVLQEFFIDAQYSFVTPTFAKSPQQPAEPLIYPVPADKELNISVPAESFEYWILNLNGQIILNRYSNSGSETADVSGIQKGVYIIRIACDENQFIKKVIFK